MYKLLNINNKYVENINNKKNKHKESSFPKFDIKANNNDSFQFLLMIFKYFELFIHSIYTFLLSFLIIVANAIYKIKISFTLISFLLRNLIVCEDNSKIPTGLIISSYFPKKKFIRITYEMIQAKEEKEKINKKNKDKENDCDDLSECNDYLNSILDNDYMIEKDTKFINKKKMLINEKKIDDFIDNKKTRYNANNNENFFDNNSINVQNILITIFSFLLMFFFIKLTFKKKKSFFLLYSLFLVISYKLMKYLYQNKYYLASNLIYILFMYSNKKVIDSIYLLLKYKRKDFEIFSTDLSATNPKQLFLKLIILFYLTVLSAIFSILLFSSWFNYIIYFLCILNILSFLGNVFDRIDYFNVKPIKNIIIFLAGILNLLLSKLLLKYYIFLNGNNEIYINKNNLKGTIVNTDLDSFYLIYDLFSAYCLNYIKGYLRLIILSGQNLTLLQLINHFHLFIIIICCVLNEVIYFKILIIIALCISYFRLNSFFFIIGIYNILIFSIAKINNQKELNNSKNILENKRYKLIIILFFQIFSFIIIKIIFLYKSMRSQSEKLNDYLDIFFNNNDLNKKLDINEGIEFFIISKLIYNKK